MATISVPESSEVPFPVHRFTVAEYRRLGELGILTPDDRVELLEGWIASKMNHSPAHSVTVALIDDALRSLLPDGWFTRTQDVVTTDDSEPEPDVTVLRGSIRDYLRRHPGPKDTALVIEVADSSLKRDRYKGQIYGRAGFHVYWIVNLAARCIEVYSKPTTDPGESGYEHRTDFTMTDSVPLVIDGKQIATVKVADLLP